MSGSSKAGRVAREIADSCIAMRCRRLSRQITRLYDEALLFKFQNSGIVCLDKDPETGSWVIVWTLMPNIG